MEASRKQDFADRRKSKYVSGGNRTVEEINQIGQILLNYGVSAVIIIVFIWDYVVNKRQNTKNQETIKTTLAVVENTTKTISNCLLEMQQTNLNTAKSLELLQKQMESTDKKVDILLERGK